MKAIRAYQNIAVGRGTVCETDAHARAICIDVKEFVSQMYVREDDTVRQQRKQLGAMKNNYRAAESPFQFPLRSSPWPSRRSAKERCQRQHLAVQGFFRIPPRRSRVSLARWQRLNRRYSANDDDTHTVFVGSTTFTRNETIHPSVDYEPTRSHRRCHQCSGIRECG
jgi:hypothetical protein